MVTVTKISIAPVKGLGLVHPDEVQLDKTGVLENRRFYLVDADGRRYGQIRNGRIVQVRPDYDSATDHLTLTFPDGTVAAGHVETAPDPIVTDFYGRPVTGHPVHGPFSEALSHAFGRELRLVQAPPGAAVDRGRGHVSLISEASLRELAHHAGHTEPVDGRRFRMLFQVDGTNLHAHAEEGWQKRRLQIGEATVRVRGAVARCAITTQNPETGVPDFDTLRILRDYRGFNADRQLDFGIYGEVLEPGRVRVGDAVEPVELSLLDATA
jgi:uncharacterized protein